VRLPIAILAASMLSTPALAERSGRSDPLPPQVTDPRAIDRVGDMVGALSHALMNVPIGEVAAAAEGRPARPEDRNSTVRDVVGPGADRKIDDRIGHGKAAAEAGMQAVAAAMPAIERAMEDMRDVVQRATANLPRPDYPRR
jgi:hypothetical protein